MIARHDTEDRKLLHEELTSHSENGVTFNYEPTEATEAIYSAAIRAIAKARQQERERVVAYLMQIHVGRSPDEHALMGDLADAIARGDHNKGTSE